MIGFVEGKVEYFGSDYVCVNVNGVGYLVNVNSSTIAQLDLGDGYIRLYTYTNVSQDAVSLIGFMDINELEIFKKLISVSGIGPKAGLAILDCMNVDELILSIASADAKSITKAKGVGLKAAEKIIIELKDKVTIADCLDNKVSTKTNKTNNTAEYEAIAALVALGYSQSEAFKTVNSIEAKENMDTEDILNAALLIL